MLLLVCFDLGQGVSIISCERRVVCSSWMPSSMETVTWMDMVFLLSGDDLVQFNDFAEGRERGAFRATSEQDGKNSGPTLFECFALVFG